MNKKETQIISITLNLQHKKHFFKYLLRQFLINSNLAYTVEGANFPGKWCVFFAVLEGSSVDKSLGEHLCVKSIGTKVA